MDSFQFKRFRILHKEGVMKVSTDSTILGAWAKGPEKGRILDAGCGTGILSLMMAQRFPELNILAIDCNPMAVSNCERNVRNSPFASQIQTLTADLYNVNMVFDAVICNPPYFTEVTTNKDANKASFRHSSPVFWLNFWHKMAQITKLLHIVLPFNRWNEMKIAIHDAGWTCTHVLEIRHHRGKETKIVCLAFALNVKNRKRAKNEILYLYEEGYWSPDYKALTRDFYIQL